MLGKFFKKPDPSMGDRVPPGQHLTNGFPIMTYGSTPEIDLATWEFKVWGLAQKKAFDWEALKSLPVHEFTADFHCVTRWSKLDVTWRGFKVKDFLALLEIDPAAKHVMQHCYGGYTTNIALEDLDRDDNFFAYELAGEPLPAEHGGPLRLVVPHLYAWKSAKWINGLEFLSSEELGFWERNGYHSHGEPFAEERYSY
ncbi:MAG: sulfite oxidase-like oxidoreductase [Geitlerinemataceae cyanobacterium]